MMDLLKSDKQCSFRSLSQQLEIRGKNYPVITQGKGTPCICIGIGTLLQKTLSESFLDQIQVYSSDLYWVTHQALAHPEELDLGQMVEDVLDIPKQLGLENYLLMAHSCFGIVALEAAKTKPQGLLGVAAVASPPRWDERGIRQSNTYFEKYASAERKANHRKRQNHFLTVKKPNESIVSLNAYEADAAKYFHQFQISREELEKLWSGIEADDRIMNHFFGTLLPRFDLAQGIEKIEVPVIVFAGKSDFDSTPILHWKEFKKPRNFTLINCPDTGHWPNLENPESFDSAFHSWYKEHIEIS